MALKLDLPPDLERELKEEAARRGEPEVAIFARALTLAQGKHQGRMPNRDTADSGLDTLSNHLLAYLRSLEQPHGVPMTGADAIAIWEREGAFLAPEDMPDAPTQARQIRERARFG